MFGKDYQVLDTDYAVAEQCQADMPLIKGMIGSKAASPLNYSDSFYHL